MNTRKLRIESTCDKKIKVGKLSGYAGCYAFWVDTEEVIDAIGYVKAEVFYDDGHIADLYFHNVGQFSYLPVELFSS